MQETQVPSLGREDPLEKKWQPSPVFLPGKSHGQRNLVAYSPQGAKSRIGLSDFTSLHFKETHVMMMLLKLKTYSLIHS